MILFDGCRGAKPIKRRVILAILIFLVVAAIVFILINSSMDSTLSHNSSSAITDIIISDDAELFEYDHTNFIVRKLAHLVEYAFLGASLIFLLLFVSSVYNKRFYSLGAFIVLLIAVFDEHIQSFSDRGSSTSDILLDFFGAFLGAVFVWLFVLLLNFIIAKKKRAYKKEA